MARIEVNLERGPVSDTPKAPVKPARELGGGGASPKKADPSKMSTADWMKWRNNQLRKGK
jgi:hypothetical protein